MRDHTITYFAVPGPDGHPRVCQAVNDYRPKDGTEITKEQADQISRDVRARQAKQETGE